MVYLNWTINAKDDLKHIEQYIAKDSVKHARLQVSRIRDRIRILHTHIDARKHIDETNQPHVRELIEGNYHIIYKIINKSRIDIYHTKRDLKKLHL